MGNSSFNMGFVRRKSVAAADAGEEVRPRNRLTKPMTRKSPTSQRTTTIQPSKPASPNISMRLSQLSLGQSTATVSERASRISMGSQPHEARNESVSKPAARDGNRKMVVASLVKQFESAASASQLSLNSSLLPQRPGSTTHDPQRAPGLYQQPRLDSAQSKERLTEQNPSTSMLVTPVASFEQLADPFRIPRRKPSNYRPGEATRKASIEHTEEQSIPKVPTTWSITRKPLPSREQKLEIDSMQEQWKPPPPLDRTDTPTSLDCKAIGGLRLGSLHVVNGRSSPVRSELSRHLISRQLRDVSSEYADSVYSKDLNQETWEDAEILEDAEEMEIIEPLTPTQVAFVGDNGELVTPTGSMGHLSRSVSPVPQIPLRTPDKTSMMAEAYQSELRNSPFSFDSNSPGSTYSVTRHDKEEGAAVSTNNQEELSSFSDVVQSKSDSRRISLESQPRSVGSKPSEAGTYNTREQKFTSALEFQAPEFQVPPSPARGVSPESTHLDRLRGQPGQSRVSLERGVSPESLHSTDTVTRHQRFSPSDRGISPVLARPESASAYSGKLDSGYHSGTSTLSLNQLGAKNAVKQTLKVDPSQIARDELAQEASSKAVSPLKEASPRKLGRFFPMRPAMRKSPATAPDISTAAGVQSESAEISNMNTAIEVKAEVSPKKIKKEQEREKEREKERERKERKEMEKEKEKEKEREKQKAKEKEREKEREEKLAKLQNKLHKERPRSRSRARSRGRAPAEIVVQRLVSCESTTDIPAVPDTAKANLQLRSEQVPELARTFTSQDHTRDLPGTSTVQLPAMDIRFPSPLPDFDDDERQPRKGKKERERSRGRVRSKSRRRSFLDIFRSDKGTGMQEREASQQDTERSIADFDDVLTSLGANPYGIAQTRSRSPHTSSHQFAGPDASPQSVSNKRQARKRLSMNDEEASKFARRRSSSFNELDSNGEQNSFASSGIGLPGKALRATVIEDEVPPVPTLPDQEELKRMSQRFSLQSHVASSPTYARQSWMEASSPSQIERSPVPPPPPAHSPRPSYHSHPGDRQHAVEMSPASAPPPPPPSHSPVPMDIPASLLPSRPFQSKGIVPDDEQCSPWDAQARAWKARRQSAGEALKFHRLSSDLGHRDDYDGQEAVDENPSDTAYPVIPPRHPDRRGPTYQGSREWMGNGSNYDYTPHDPYLRKSQTWDGVAFDSRFHEDEEHRFSESSFRSRQRRDCFGEDEYGYGPESQSHPHPHHHIAHGSRQSDLRSKTSTDSRQSFHSHHNRHIDRPFDTPPRFSGESNDDHRFHDQHRAQSSPLRDRGMYSPKHDRALYNDHESRQQYHYENDYRPHYYDHNQYRADYTPSSPSQSMSHQHFNNHPSASSYSSSPLRIRAQGDSLLPPSPVSSRPTSRQSKNSARPLHLNKSATSLAEELNPEERTHAPPVSDFGRYSGGLAYGYEGREAGFGGSAGTRSTSGKADGMFKGMPLRENYGVDLGDVPVIGVVKKVK